jgi:hypothetical protein
MDSITITCNDETEEKIGIILRQTTYTPEEAKCKLIEKSGDHIKVIRSFMGITEKKELPINSMNQEIYRQLRNKLNISQYNERQQREFESKITKDSTD